MRFFRALIPAPLLRLDHHLLLHYPRLWATRTHYHLWFLLLCNAAVLALALLVPVSTQHFPDPETLFGWMMLPALIYFAFWVYKLVLFSPEKNLAPGKHWTISVEFLVLWASITLIMSLPYTLGQTVNYRIAHSVTDAELQADVDSLNRHAWLFLDEDARYFSSTKKWQTSTLNSHAYYRSETEYREPSLNAEKGTPPLQQVYSGLINRYNQLNDNNSGEARAEKERLRTAIDSIETNYPLYFVQFGRFTPNRSWFFEEPDQHQYALDLLTTRYLKDLQRDPLVDLRSVDHILDLARKYDGIHRIPAATEVRDAFLQGKGSRMHWYGTQRRIGDIHKAKMIKQFFQQWWIMLYVVLITAFVLTVLLCMFRSLYWQPFLLLLTTCALLPVLVFFFLMLGDLGSDKAFVNTWWALGIGVLVSAYLQRKSPVYAPYRAVVHMLADLAAAFMLFYTLVILHGQYDIFQVDALRSGLQELSYGSPAYMELQAAVMERSNLVDMIIHATLWVGMLGYALLLHPLFRTGYLRLYALPERK